MDFELSSEQTMLKDSVDRFVQDKYDFEARRALVASELGYSKKNWQLFAEMGWLGLLFSEESGGYGGTAVEASILMESFGGGLVLEPFLSSVLLAGRLVDLAGTDDQKSEILPALISGELMLALAYSEQQSRFDLADVATSAAAGSGGYVLNGHKSVVHHAASADKILVTARLTGDRCDRLGIGVFIIDADAKGLTRQDYRTLDGQRASDVMLDNVAVDRGALLGNSDDALASLEAVVDLAICAVGAEAVGAMRKVIDVTSDYVKTRQQFGAPIGANQVIKHRLADMLMEAEQAKSMADMAAMRCEAEPENRQAIAAATQAKIGVAARFVGEQGIQLHGGIGMTDEYVIGHYYKRLKVIESLFGNPDFHLRRYSQVA